MRDLAVLSTLSLTLRAREATSSEGLQRPCSCRIVTRVLVRSPNDLDTRVFGDDIAWVPFFTRSSESKFSRNVSRRRSDDVSCRGAVSADRAQAVYSRTCPYKTILPCTFYEPYVPSSNAPYEPFFYELSIESLKTIVCRLLVTFRLSALHRSPMLIFSYVFH